MVLFIHSAGNLRRNNDRALQLPVTHVFHGLLLVVIGDGHKGPNIGAHGIESFLDPHRLWSAVLVYDGNLGVANLAAKGVAQDDQLHQGKDHRCQHQSGRAEEFAHFALDYRHHPIHRM